MAEAYKVLGQSNPIATTPTNVYTVPGATAAIISTITVCNRSAVATTFRISVAVAGSGADNKQYIAYDAPIDGNDTISLTLGIPIAAADVVWVYATLATLSFGVFGIEVS